MNGALVAVSAAAGAILGIPLELLVEKVPGRVLLATADPSDDPTTDPTTDPTGDPVGVLDAQGGADLGDEPAEDSGSDPAGPVTAGTGGPRVMLYRMLLLSLVTALFLAGAAVRFGPHLELAAYDLLILGLVTMSAVDLERMIIPVRLLYPTAAVFAAVLLAVAGVDGRWNDFWVAAATAAACFAVFLAIHLIVPAGMGFGDVRLAGLLGGAAGWISPKVAAVGFVVAFGLGAVIGVALMVFRGYGGKSRVPFAPFLVAGALVAFQWGRPIAHFWLHTG